MAEIMRQEAPYPDALAEIVDGWEGRDGWGARLRDNYDRGQGCVGLTLIISIMGPNSYPPHDTIAVDHLFVVPAAAYDYRSWRHWFFGCLGQVSFHEDMEHFTIDGEKPYAPSHGPGNDPYLLREVGTDVDRRTSFRGEVKDG
jgi:hypothetical protein